MNTDLIESYCHHGAGYEPFLIRPGWQVAQLKYMPELRADVITRVERHMQTDEVFILCKGHAMLVAGREGAAGLDFEAVSMEPGVTYNVPAGVWHNIVLTPDDLVSIVEKDHTHLTDVEYRDFTPQEQAAWQQVIKQTKNQGCPT